MKIPEGEYCYTLSVFSDSYECSHYDGTISRQPKCSKFKVDLGWSISGRVQKCQGCIREDSK